MKFFNKYLGQHFENIICLLFSEGRRSCLFSQKIQFSIENKTLEYTENDITVQYIINNNEFHVFSIK